MLKGNIIKKIKNNHNSENVKYCIVAAMNAFVLLRFYIYAWVTDDAFITFRSVINFVNGYGPVYNIGERVQSFTHPLWFFLLSLGGVFDLNLFFWSITLGIIFSVCTLQLLYKIYKTGVSTPIYLLSLVILSFSESVLSYQTSGLENSLTNLLLVLIIYFLFSNRYESYKLFIVSFVASLLLLNRLDQLFLIVIPVVYVYIKSKRSFVYKLKTLLLATLPLWLWELFSLFYYGFLFPNTRYAKVGKVPIQKSFSLGVNYFLEFIQTEIAFVIFFILLVTYFIRKHFFQRKKFDSYIVLFFLVSVFLHYLYILYVGGDFMRGRFYVSSIFVVVTLSLYVFKDYSVKHIYQVILLFFFLFGNVVCYYHFGFNENIYMHHGISNERNFYKKHLSLSMSPYDCYSFHPWGEDAIELNNDKRKRVIVGVNGQRGYWCDKHITLIDMVGLTDPFIARLPVVEYERVGHMGFDVPEEYIEERVNGYKIKKWKNEKYQNLSYHISVVTTHNLFSYERLKSMIWMWKHYGV
jgi:arabinofuranosyltransferase